MLDSLTGAGAGTGTLAGTETEHGTGTLAGTGTEHGTLAGARTGV